MNHIRAINQKAARIEAQARQDHDAVAGPNGSPDVVALESRQAQGPHIPLGCSLLFSPGWEVDSSGGTAGLCQPVERDLFDCYHGCFWPVQVPDHLNHAPDWTSKCATAQQDWRKVDLIFP